MGKGAQLIPAAVPLVLVPLHAGSDADLGVIRAGDACYDKYRHCVDQVTEQGFALFAQ